MLAERVERAFSDEFQARLKERVLSKYRHFSDRSYDWALLELKRYFLMNLLLRGVPMFSERVDDLWHEMLLFTHDYQEFCTRLAGRFIHHNPYLQRTPMPEERAWFDWVYAQIFLFTPYTQALWKPFFRNPIDSDRLRKFASLSEAELVSAYFNTSLYDRDPTVREAIRYLINQAKVQSVSALTHREAPKQAPRYTLAPREGLTDYSVLTPMLMATSLWGTNVLHELMAPYYPSEAIKRRASAEGDASVCGAFGGCDNHSNDHDGGDAGDAGGGDSGCGGGCGGGCGS